MPIYEYKCTACDHRFEIEQRIVDDPLTSLAGCQVADDGNHPLKKVFSAIGIAFKGDGFYRNDARGKARSSSATASDTPSKSTETSSDSSSTTESSSKSSSSTDSSSSPAPTNGSSSTEKAKSTSSS